MPSVCFSVPGVEGQRRPRVYARGGHAGMYKAKAVTRDDGRSFRCLADACVAAGYSNSGQTQAKKRIAAGKEWKDGHVYRFAEAV